MLHLRFSTRAKLIALGIVMSIILLGIVWGLVHKKTNSAHHQSMVQGFDVSHHQKQIQWQKISPQKYQFVYLKATEGGDFSDTRFQENWLKAREQGLYVGAYHFYRLCRDGKTQAQHFIHTVPKKPDALPPAIDLEYDSTCINHYSKEQLLNEIQIMHDALLQHYEKQPIFYTTPTFYHIVLVGHFKNTPLWIRDYKGQPKLPEPMTWLFWQYSNQGKIEGINGPVDVNRFNGNPQDWQDFLIQQQVIKQKAID